MKQSIKSTLVLVAVCAIMALVLALTNAITAPIIERNENEKANGALLEVMADGGSFEKVDISTFTLPATVKEAYKATNGGYVFRLETTGYASGFVIMCGVYADGTVSGAVCISSGETLGYEKTFGANFAGKDAQGVDAVDSISGATRTVEGYRNAVKDAINASIILGGGSVDLRTEEEILNDNLSEALPAADGAFEKHFFVEVVEGVDAIYEAKNGKGYVCVIGESFIAVDENGAVISDVSDDVKTTVETAIATVKASTVTELDLAVYEEALTAQKLKTYVISAKVTASGNYVLEMKGAGYGITGGDEYHPASGEYIVIRLSMTKEGKIIDCYTVSQAETEGFGSVCGDESFYGQFDGKTEDNYLDIDVINGATLTTDGYTKAIQRAFNAVKIFAAGGTEDAE